VKRELLDRLRSGSRISAGIATADWLNLGRELEQLRSAEVDTVHLDVMDGAFCPVVAAPSPAMARAIAADFLVDVHLIVERPERVVQPWFEAEVHVISFHLEATRHPLGLLRTMSDRPVVRGVAILPSTPVAMLEPLLDDLELVLLLAVTPGLKGERFSPATVPRVRQAIDLIEGRDIVVAVDGSISRDGTPGELARAGADVIVSGSAIFDGGDPAGNATEVADQIRAGTPVSAGHRDG
jgi:ribulose-phosphate 3-epimerase